MTATPAPIEPQTYDPALGKGGCWLTPAGEVWHVKDRAEHFETVRARGIEGYTGAYDAGMIRVSTYGQNEIVFNFPLKVTLHTLRAFRRHMAVFKECRGFVEWELEGWYGLAVEERTGPVAKNWLKGEWSEFTRWLNQFTAYVAERERSQAEAPVEAEVISNVPQA